MPRKSRTTFPPQYAVIDVSTSGDNTIVSAITDRRIRVLKYNFMAAGTVNARWKSGASTNLSGLSYLVANTGKVVPSGNDDSIGWLETNQGDALVLNLSAGVAVGGELVYVEVET